MIFEEHQIIAKVVIRETEHEGYKSRDIQAGELTAELKMEIQILVCPPPLSQKQNHFVL